MSIWESTTLNLNSFRPDSSITCRKRSFVLSCFLADDSVAIFEPIKKNSGIIGGKYLERRQVGLTMPSI